MTQRERYLALGVAVITGLVGMQFAFNKVTNTLQEKRDAVQTVRRKSSDMDKTTTSGKIAARKIESLSAKSLPSDEETMIAQYKHWLSELGEAVGMEKIKASEPSRALRTTPAFTSYQFTLTGLCRMDRVLELMAKFLDKDYLHSMQSLKMTETSQPNVFTVRLVSHVLALRGAPAKQEPSAEPSGRLAMSIDEYKELILGRNIFSPPNKPPKITTSVTHTIHCGESWSLDLAADDPEKHTVHFTNLSGELPEGIEFENGSFSGTPKENCETEIIVQATDDGWPSQSTELKLVFKIVDPPVEAVEEEPAEFDVATQTYVSGLVSGLRGPEVMIRSYTDGKLISLTTGSDFEIGTIKAKVVSINLRESFVELESDGVRWMCDMDTSLADAYKESQVD